MGIYSYLIMHLSHYTLELGMSSWTLNDSAFLFYYIIYEKYHNESIYSFEHHNLTEKFSFRWELNHMPLTFQLSTITTRPLKPFLSHPLSKALYWPHGLDHHCRNFILCCEVPIEHYNFSRCTMIINKIILLNNSIWLEKIL